MKTKTKIKLFKNIILNTQQKVSLSFEKANENRKSINIINCSQKILLSIHARSNIHTHSYKKSCKKYTQYLFTHTKIIHTPSNTLC